MYTCIITQDLNSGLSNLIMSKHSIFFGQNMIVANFYLFRNLFALPLKWKISYFRHLYVVNIFYMYQSLTVPKSSKSKLMFLSFDLQNISHLQSPLSFVYFFKFNMKITFFFFFFSIFLMNKKKPKCNCGV